MPGTVAADHGAYLFEKLARTFQRQRPVPGCEARQREKPRTEPRHVHATSHADERIAGVERAVALVKKS